MSKCCVPSFVLLYLVFAAAFVFLRLFFFHVVIRSIVSEIKFLARSPIVSLRERDVTPVHNYKFWQRCMNV